MKDYKKITKKKAARNTKKKKRREMVDIISYLRKSIKIFFVLLGLCLGGAAVYGSCLFIASTEYLHLTNVIIEGNKMSSKEEILASAGFGYDTNTLLIPVKETVVKISRLPWISSVSIERRLPNSLKIDVKERKPIALVYLEGYYYIDREGYIFARANRTVGWNYPVLTGISKANLLAEDDESISLLDEGLGLVKYLSSREGYISWAHVSEALLDLKKGITIYTTFENGIPVHLGRGDLPDRIIRSEKVLVDLKRKGMDALSLKAAFDDRVVVEL